MNLKTLVTLTAPHVALRAPIHFKSTRQRLNLLPNFKLINLVIWKKVNLTESALDMRNLKITPTLPFFERDYMFGLCPYKYAYRIDY